MKKWFATLMAICLLTAALPTGGAVAAAPAPEAGAALLMEKETGRVLYAQKEHDKLEPASVTKIMTLLLVMEAIQAGRITMDEMVSVSACAAGMGGSQVYMKEGEQFSVHDMLKCVAVVSGNDAAVALAEHLAGSEEGARGQNEPPGGRAGDGGHLLPQLHGAACRRAPYQRLRHRTHVPRADFAAPGDSGIFHHLD